MGIGVIRVRVQIPSGVKLLQDFELNQIAVIRLSVIPPERGMDLTTTINEHGSRFTA